MNWIIPCSFHAGHSLMRAIAIFVFFVWHPASASTLQQLTLEDMAQKSTAIVRVKVNGSNGTRYGTDVFTVYRFETLETVKRPNGPPPIEVGVPGGFAGGMRQVVAGAPVLRAGQEYILFLWTGRSGLAQVIGMSQGLFAVDRTTAGDSIATRGMAGERMLDGTGHAVRDEAVSMPWPELRAKIIRALKAGAVAEGTR
jgi:hypothetical protein